MSDRDSQPRKRIRGSYRRRLLGHLADGPTSVSVAGNAVGLRLPHASAEMKKLRHEGLVYSDSDNVQRGALQHLTREGWGELVSDELSRLEQSDSNIPPDGATGRLLAVDGPQLLLAYTKRLSSPLIPLPKGGHYHLPKSDEGSSGNNGVKDDWVWAVAREAKVRWYNSETFEQVSAPNNSDDASSSLADWIDNPPTIGLVRARLLDPRQSFLLPIGTWFGEPGLGEYPTLPLPMGESKSWELGIAHEKVPPLVSQCPIFAIMPDRLSTTSLLTSLSEGALVIAEAPRLGGSISPLPLGILKPWVALVHPRLGENEHRIRFEGLCEAIRKGRRNRTGVTRVEESTWRRFQSDWPEREWIDELPHSQSLIDVSGLTQNGWLSTIIWSLERESEESVVIQYPPGISNQNHLKALFADHRTRLVILDHEPEQPLNFPTLRRDKLRPLSWYSLTLAGDVNLPCRVTRSLSSVMDSPPHGWVPPTTAFEVAQSVILARSLFTSSTPPDVGESSSAEMRMFAAVLRYPTGDSDWANKIETTDPIAAWIATPQSERWPLWRRRGWELGDDWIPLLSPENVPLEQLPHIAGNSMDEWQEIAHKYAIALIRSDHDVSYRLRTVVEEDNLSPKSASWLALTLLSQVAWLAEELTKDIAKWAPNVLSEDPPSNIIPMLDGMRWLENNQLVDDDWADLFSLDSESSSMMRGWKILAQFQSGEVGINLEQISDVISLPCWMWSPFAEEILLRLCDSPDGRELLFKTDICWPAALFQPIEKSVDIPGIGEVQTQKLTPELLIKLSKTITFADADSEALPALRDIIESLKAVGEGNTPSLGKTHPHVGWLVQPVSHWPRFSTTELTSGTDEISILLSNHKSAFHEGLRSSLQRRL